MIKEINRIRKVLAELNIKNKWLANRIEKKPSTILLWTNNERQPSLETPIQTANVLCVDVIDLIISTKQNQQNL